MKNIWPTFIVNLVLLRNAGISVPDNSSFAMSVFLAGPNAVFPRATLLIRSPSRKSPEEVLGIREQVAESIEKLSNQLVNSYENSHDYLQDY